MDLRSMFEVWDRIGGLDQRVRLHYIQPEISVTPWVPSLAARGQAAHPVIGR